MDLEFSKWVEPFRKMLYQQLGRCLSVTSMKRAIVFDFVFNTYRNGLDTFGNDMKSTYDNTVDRERRNERKGLRHSRTSKLLVDYHDESAEVNDILRRMYSALTDADKLELVNEACKLNARGVAPMSAVEQANANHPEFGRNKLKYQEFLGIVAKQGYELSLSLSSYNLMKQDIIMYKVKALVMVPKKAANKETIQDLEKDGVAYKIV
jgi:hypothetical protein